MKRRHLAAPLALLAWAGTVAGQVPSPESHFGFAMGADRHLADWDELTDYYEVLARASPRITVDTLGTSTLGRPLVMLTITSPANHRRLAELQRIQRRLADPRTVSGPDELESLLEAGRVVVLLTHGVHATEVGSAQMAARLAWRLASSDEPDVAEILDNVIVLDVPSLNPDGTQWVVDWYEDSVGKPWEGGPLPWLYHLYAGHDLNRDWYAFTQEETRLTVEKAHNAWHPQIVHDVHQMDVAGARIFFPPYIDPVEPNVDPALVASLNQLGAFMAAKLTTEGKAGVVTHALYDAFSPGRAYPHYHGGVRILSETASALLASPVQVPFEALRPGPDYDPTQASWNFPLPWEGGVWRLGDAVDYMEAGALALLTNAALHRRLWLETAWGVAERAVAGWDRWPDAWVIPASPPNLANRSGLDYLLRVLATGDVEVHRTPASFTVDGMAFPPGSWVVPMRQPYASFAQTLLELQDYPDVRAYPGGPPRRPYDVTAHTLPLLLGIEAVPVRGAVDLEGSQLIDAPPLAFEPPALLAGAAAPRIGLYKSWDEPLEAGWTRWLLDRHAVRYDTIHDAEIRRGSLADRYDVILLQNQSPRSIVAGLAPGDVPPAYAGGIGPEGLRSLREFVRAGGRIVAVEQATDLVIDLFDLGVSNVVDRLPPDAFYVPGSILRMEWDEASPLARGLPWETAAWYWESSRAFRVTDPTIRVAARYGEGDPLLSGWMLGPRFLAGQPAVLEAAVGRGSVVLIGFQPNYRGQSVTTWPLLWNALSVPRRGETAEH